jgi:polysaccharide export outer membrane protein
LIGMPAQAQQSAASANAQAGEAYRINPGDELEVYVWGEERLQRGVRVLPDGTIAFPLVGQLMAQGKLPSELEAAISSALASQYRGEVPQVTVSVTSPAGMQFSVLGRVNSPGSFATGRYINILEALSMAGGGTEFADLGSVTIIRKNGSQLQVLRANVAPLLRKGVRDEDLARANIVRVEAGDTIIVP